MANWGSVCQLEGHGCYRHKEESYTGIIPWHVWGPHLLHVVPAEQWQLYSFIHPSVHSFIHETFIEHLMCAECSIRLPGGSRSKREVVGPGAGDSLRNWRPQLSSCPHETLLFSNKRTLPGVSANHFWFLFWHCFLLTASQEDQRKDGSLKLPMAV